MPWMYNPLLELSPGTWYYDMQFMWQLTKLSLVTGCKPVLHKHSVSYGLAIHYYYNIPTQL